MDPSPEMTITRKEEEFIRALAAASQPFSLSLRIQTTFYFPIQIHTTIDSLNLSPYH
jgi:hypothetical protein